MASKWLNFQTSSLWCSGQSMTVPGPPIFLVEGMTELAGPTTSRTGRPSRGCITAAACSFSPFSPTIAALP